MYNNNFPSLLLYFHSFFHLLAYIKEDEDSLRNKEVARLIHSTILDDLAAEAKVFPAQMIYGFSLILLSYLNHLIFDPPSITQTLQVLPFEQPETIADTKKMKEDAQKKEKVQQENQSKEQQKQKAKASDVIDLSDEEEEEDEDTTAIPLASRFLVC